MATPTIIRHKLTPDGFAIVVTTFVPRFTAALQVYKVNTTAGNRTFLDKESLWGDEGSAIAEFERI